MRATGDIVSNEPPIPVARGSLFAGEPRFFGVTNLKDRRYPQTARVPALQSIDVPRVDQRTTRPFPTSQSESRKIVLRGGHAHERIAILLRTI
jgi:hypothetical protein